MLKASSLRSCDGYPLKSRLCNRNCAASAPRLPSGSTERESDSVTYPHALTLRPSAQIICAPVNVFPAPGGPWIARTGRRRVRLRTPSVWQRSRGTGTLPTQLLITDFSVQPSTDTSTQAVRCRRRHEKVDARQDHAGLICLKQKRADRGRAARFARR
jgi:hypothetical protein